MATLSPACRIARGGPAGWFLGIYPDELHETCHDALLLLLGCGVVVGLLLDSLDGLLALALRLGIDVYGLRDM